ncbi:MAG: RNA polymerase subunit sigma-24, partial [Polyangiaceae bacterium]|nr:RNA polymerase subunit sigma-24 [Polyangiaceae bacterium]
MSDPTKSAVAAVWKEQAPRLIGALVRIVRDVSLAEELAQDALVAALEEWPRTGIPDKPGAWLMTTAKNRAINVVRRAKISARVGESLEHDMDTELSLTDLESALEAHMDQDVRDDVLRLVFAACHPVLSKEARVALTLRMIGGLT